MATEETDEVPSEDRSLAWMLRAFQSPSYRVFFVGQIVSLCGTWLSTVATSWLVYRLAQSQDASRTPFILGMVGFSSQLPSLLLAPLAGVLIDRWPRRQILLTTQALSMAQSFALAALVLSGQATIPRIIALSIFQGLINALDLPARQTFVTQLVPPEHLSNAIALSSSMVHTARVVGPALAGFLIYLVGEGICFLIDGGSYLAVLLSLMAVRVRERPAPTKTSAWRSFREGLDYAWRFRPIRVLLTTVATLSCVASSQAVLMPLIADQSIGGGERTLGLLLGASGCGALAGSLYLASRRSVLGLGRVIVIGAATYGLALLCFAGAQTLAVAMPLLAVVGLAMVIQMAACNTILQTIVEDDKRGRVMSLFAIAFFGTAPLGSLLAGGIATVVGARWTLVAAAIICLSSALRVSLQLRELRDLIRPIYVSKGIIPASYSTLNPLPPTVQKRP